MSELQIPPVQSSTVKRPTETSKESILFVDDEPNILSSLRRLFRPLGYTLYQATSAKEGLEILSQHSIDLIISDMRMPEMDGAEFLREVAIHYPDVIRILLTGFSDIDSTVEAINKGKIYRYLSKPWEDTDVTLTVGQALHTKRLETEKKRLAHLTQFQNDQLKELNQNLEHKVEARSGELKQTAEMLDLAYQQLSASYQQTIRVFTNLISMREHLSGRDADKIASLARAMAKLAKLDSEQVQDIYFSGLLHELGKLSLPDHLLDRPFFCLSPKAQKKYQQHPTLGQSSLMAIEALQPSAAIIGAHEEYFDGSGFPQKLHGIQIPIGARILSITKDFYGLRNGKFQTEALSNKAALGHVQLQGGKKYDPHLVEILVQIVEHQPDLEREPTGHCVNTAQLEPGMRLSHDLYNNSEMLLLTKGRVLTELLVEKLRRLERHEEHPYVIYVAEEPKQ
ncbi:MAG: HD domain-containing phosphohydrolase [Halopseudomonas sp.]